MTDEMCTRLHSESKIDLQVPILVLIHEKTVAYKIYFTSVAGQLAILASYSTLVH